MMITESLVVSSASTSAPIFALIGVVIGAVISSLVTWRTARMTVTAAFEGEKYKQRLAIYQALWARTQQIRKTPEDQDLTTAAMATTLTNLDEWYFQTGGLLLTDQARAAYFSLVDAIQSTIALNTPNLSPAQYERVYDAATKLRDITATEVRGRSGTPFTSKATVETAKPLHPF
ncbi:hypothetical protein AB0P21_20850 [Kribbella sp. NPDC056861]|uniref:hypothetical protein n=1 Tax=Kribbella sp. NPDC056861 TaxID=3154857 RepID=UPI00342A6CC7